MKRAVLLLVVALSASACATSKGGARGPVIHHTDDAADKAEPQTGSLDGRAEVGQR